MLYRAENRSVFVEGCNFKIKCPKKLRPAGDYCHLKVSTLKVNQLGHPMTIAVLGAAIKETHTSLYSFSHGLLCSVTHFLLELFSVVTNTEVQNSAN